MQVHASHRLFFVTPFGGDADEKAVIAFGHRPGKNRYVVLIEQVVDTHFEREVGKPQRE